MHAHRHGGMAFYERREYDLLPRILDSRVRYWIFMKHPRRTHPHELALGKSPIEMGNPQNIQHKKRGDDNDEPTPERSIE